MNLCIRWLSELPNIPATAEYRFGLSRHFGPSEQSYVKSLETQ